MQLSLMELFPFPVGSWVRKTRSGMGVVIWISNPCEAAKRGLVGKLLKAGAKSRGTELLDGGVAACLVCPAWMQSQLLTQLPGPPSRGSNTPGNYLPW